METVIFTGGGLKGITYIGFLKYVQEHSDKWNIRTVVGHSAGSIFALMYILGYTWDSLRTKMIELDLGSSFQVDFFRVRTEYCILDISKLETWILGWIQEKGVSAETTFRELSELSPIKLIFACTNLNTYETDHFGTDQTPEVSVYQALLASISIPFLFPLRYINETPYTDGGLISQAKAPDGVDPEKTLVILLDQKRESRPKIGSFDVYARRMIECVYWNLSENRGPLKYKYTLHFQNPGSLISFEPMEPEEIDYLISIGYYQTEKFVGKLSLSG